MIPLQASFEDLGVPLFDVTFCVLDLETTGGSPVDSAITEIGAVKVRAGEVVGTFQTLVNPRVAIPPFITILTGITHAMVIGAPPIEAALPCFLEFLGDAVVVGHNVAFDLRFLQSASTNLGYPRLRNRVVDTYGLARRLIRPEIRNLKLATLANHLGSPVRPNHRALDDAMATMHVFHALLERAGSLGVSALEDLLILPTAKGSPDYRKIHLATDLPRRPGVYVFRDRDANVLYVGKANNLRTRVMSYFHGDDRRSTGDLVRRLHAIEAIVCSGEVEALITELRLIHAHRPPFNRRSRPSKADHFLTLTKERFPRLSLSRSIRTDALLTLGPFRNRQAAELVMTAIWDAIPIRRCTGGAGRRSAPCAPAQLGVALCPCDGSLSESRYAMVVDTLLEGVTRDGTVLSERLITKMSEHATGHRFEEAGWIRDRHQALAKAIERRRRWQALTSSGRLEIETSSGEHVLVDGGRFVAAWPSGSPHPLLPVEYPEVSFPEIPPTTAVGAELDLLWKMVDAPGSRIVRGEFQQLAGVGMPNLERLEC